MGDSAAPFLGLGLESSILEKIYYRNFEKAVGVTPRPVNPGVIIELCNQVETTLEMLGSSQPGVPGDFSVVRTVRSYFESIS